jgi:hypothetical protein
MQTDASLIDQVTHSLQALPDVQVRATRHAQQGAAWDACLDIAVQGRPATLLLICKAHGYPRDIRAALWQWEARLPAACESEPPSFPMFVAPSLSSGSRALLQEKGIAYAEDGGSLYLRLPWALLLVDRPAPSSAPRIAKTLYQGRRAQVLHILLSAPTHAWHIQELAAQAQVAPSTVHEVFSALEAHEWVEREGKGPHAVRRLCAPGRLLDAWAEAHTLQRYAIHSFYTWTQSPAQRCAKVVSSLEQLAVPYALTLSSGAELVAPFVTGSDTLSLLLPFQTPLASLMAQTGLQTAEEGANVRFLLCKDAAPLLLRRQLETLWVASDIQLYLDLWAWPARGKEQAKHLRQERLGF